MGLVRNYICHNQGCQQPFTTSRHGQRFCSGACKSADAYTKRLGGVTKEERKLILQCKKDKIRQKRFWKSDCFSEGTIFSVDPEEPTRYYVYCPDCDSTNSAHYQLLQNGSRPCNCSVRRHTQGYICLLSDNGLPVGLKYGIANNAQYRTNCLSISCSFDVSVIGIWEYEDKQSCMLAERVCKKSFDKAVSKADMPDGYTETTHIYNLDKIISIYEEYGGVKIS